MENEILIGSNSDLIIQSIFNELERISEVVHIRIIGDLDDVTSVQDGQLVIIDLSVYAPGIIDRIEKFKCRYPNTELIAVTYTNDELIDQMLVKRGIDQVASRDELPDLVRNYIRPQLKTTG